MGKIIKNISKNLFVFLLGGIVLGSIGIYAAIQYNASDVGYKNTTVKKALDDLYKGKCSSSSNSDAYGVKRLINSQYSSWERIGASSGLVAYAQIGSDSIQNDFDNIYPWSEIKSYNYNTDTKEITAWYGESGFTFTPEGNVEVLTYIPEFYYKREQKDGYEYIYITRNEKQGFTKSEAFSVGRYIMSGNATRVHSKSGTSPLLYTTISQYREYSRNLDPNYIANDAEHPSEFGQMDYHYFILQLLYLVEYADYNSQVKLGLGYSNTSHKAVIGSGGCNDLGMKSGTLNNDGNNSVIYRGIEDIYGNAVQFLDGMNFKNGQAYVCYNASKYKSDTFNDATGDAYNECYKPIGYTPINTSGYVSKLGYDGNNSLIALPTTVVGTDSTYIPDYYIQGSGITVAVVGGDYNSGNKNGLWYFISTMTTSASTKYSVSRFIKTVGLSNISDRVT